MTMLVARRIRVHIRTPTPTPAPTRVIRVLPEQHRPALLSTRCRSDTRTCPKRNGSCLSGARPCASRKAIRTSYRCTHLATLRTPCSGTANHPPPLRPRPFVPLRPTHGARMCSGSTKDMQLWCRPKRLCNAGPQGGTLHNARTSQRRITWRGVLLSVSTIRTPVHQSV